MVLFQKLGLSREGSKKIVSQRRLSSTCSEESLRTLFVIYAQNDWKLHSIDIKTAFLQGNLLTCDIFINPPPEAGYPSTHAWKLNKCIYGLCDPSFKWYSRVCNFVPENNGKISKFEPR